MATFDPYISISGSDPNHNLEGSFMVLNTMTPE